MFYTARDGDNPLKLQLHRVGLDGRGDVRLTDPKFHHTVGSCMAGAAGGRGRGGAGSCGIAADNKHFVDVYQTHNTPPATRRRRRRVGQGRGGGGGERFDEVRAARAEEGGAVHLQGRGRPDDAARVDSVPVDVRSVAQVSGAGAGLRRAGVGEQHRARDVRHALSADRVRLPRRQRRLARRAGTRQAPARSDLPEARAGRDRRHGGRRAVARQPAVRRCGAGGHVRDLLRRLCVGDVAAAASGRVRRRLGVVAGDGLEPLRHASTPSATCGSRRRTRPATTPAAR